MAASIWVSFGWAFYLAAGLAPFISTLCLLGFFGGNFAMYSLWIPEQYPTAIRATAFAFVTSFGRFIGAGVNFLIASGYSGQTTENFYPSALQEVVGVRIPSYASLSVTYKFGRTGAP